MRIDQLVPHLSAHDAVGNHVFQVQRALRAAGFGSEIYAEHIDPRLADRAQPFASCLARAEGPRALLYQASTDTEMLPWLKARAAEGQPVLSNYHNITPAEFFERFEPEVSVKLRLARRQLAELAPITSLALAVSEFNAAELVDLGYPDVRVAPLLVDLDGLGGPSDGELAARLGRQAAAGGNHWLFVGRRAPNKCQHDLMAAFALHRRLTDPRSRLTLIGGEASPGYAAELRALAAQLEIEDALELRDSLTQAELLAYYRAADVFVCQSEHEGFCIPLLEAMAVGLPIVAYAAAAVPATVGDAAVLLDEKDPLVTAVAVGDVLANPDLRATLVARGRERAQTFGLRNAEAVLVKAIGDWAAGAGGAPTGTISAPPSQEVR